jgi:hypothetical protein|tara:strand:- start:257 stop:448 length:192 start_codon:yes stop_codon:yes gene_type:complete
MIRTPEWQAPLYRASTGVATLLDEIDLELGDDEGSDLYRHAELLQLEITRLENILYKEKANGF